MTEDELKAIEERAKHSAQYLLPGDTLALIAEIRRLNAELRQWHDPVRQAQGAWSPIDGKYIE
jgi:hypothetical protein